MPASNLRPADDADIRWMGENMSPADRAEGDALCVNGAAELLTFSAKIALLSLCWEVEGTPVLIGGLGSRSLMGEVGIPWLVTSPATQMYPIAAYKVCRAMVHDRFLKMFPILQNVVDARHHAAMRWLTMLGFRLEETPLWGPKGVPFHRFELRA